MADTTEKLSGRLEKLLEVDFEGGKPVRAGNQFGVGGVTGR